VNPPPIDRFKHNQGSLSHEKARNSFDSMTRLAGAADFEKVPVGFDKAGWSRPRSLFTCGCPALGDAEALAKCFLPHPVNFWGAYDN